MTLAMYNCGVFYRVCEHMSLIDSNSGEQNIAVFYKIFSKWYVAFKQH